MGIVAEAVGVDEIIQEEWEEWNERAKDDALENFNVLGRREAQGGDRGVESMVMQKLGEAFPHLTS